MPINTYKYRYTWKGNTCEGNTYKGKYRCILTIKVMLTKINVGLLISIAIFIALHLAVAVLGMGILVWSPEYLFSGFTVDW